MMAQQTDRGTDTARNLPRDDFPGCTVTWPGIPVDPWDDIVFNGNRTELAYRGERGHGVTSKLPSLGQGEGLLSSPRQTLLRSLPTTTQVHFGESHPSRPKLKAGVNRARPSPSHRSLVTAGPDQVPANRSPGHRALTAEGGPAETKIQPPLTAGPPGGPRPRSRAETKIQPPWH